MLHGTKKYQEGNDLETTHPGVQISYRGIIPEEKSPGGEMSGGKLSLDGNDQERKNPWDEFAEEGVVLGVELS